MDFDPPIDLSGTEFIVLNFGSPSTTNTKIVVKLHTPSKVAGEIQDNAHEETRSKVYTVTGDQQVINIPMSDFAFPASSYEKVQTIQIEYGEYDDDNSSHQNRLNPDGDRELRLEKVSYKVTGARLGTITLAGETYEPKDPQDLVNWLDQLRENGKLRSYARFKVDKAENIPAGKELITISTSAGKRSVPFSDLDQISANLRKEVIPSNASSGADDENLDVDPDARGDSAVVSITHPPKEKNEFGDDTDGARLAKIRTGFEKPEGQAKEFFTRDVECRCCDQRNG
jgi:hypothetical protein